MAMDDAAGSPGSGPREDHARRVRDAAELVLDRHAEALRRLDHEDRR